MSYSRWSNSVWYTYSDVKGGFTVCGEKNFSDEELKDIDQCLKFFDETEYTVEEIQELRGYMELYVKNEMIQRKMEAHSFDNEPTHSTKEASRELCFYYWVNIGVYHCYCGYLCLGAIMTDRRKRIEKMLEGK